MLMLSSDKETTVFVCLFTWEVACLITYIMDQFKFHKVMMMHAEKLNITARKSRLTRMDGL